MSKNPAALRNSYTQRYKIDMQITAAMVKELRERSGAGVMECKKALKEANGDAERAIELLRKSGQIKAEKFSGKTTAEGVVKALGSDRRYVLVEINCETDFVARSENFNEFSEQIAATILSHHPDSLDEAAGLPINGTTIEKKRLELVGKIGENIQLRRFQYICLNGDTVAVYLHGSHIAVLVDMRGGDTALAKDVAMHIAASRPVCISAADINPAILAKEQRILHEQAAASGKPADIIDKMTAGRLKKFIRDISLLGQNFVKEPDKTVLDLLQENNAEVLCFHRYELGEGINKEKENFAEEVMAQVQGCQT